jgi:hypothetical protein
MLIKCFELLFRLPCCGYFCYAHMLQVSCICNVGVIMCYIEEMDVICCYSISVSVGFFPLCCV